MDKPEPDRRRQTAAERLDEIGIDEIAGRIRAGESQREISTALSMSVDRLSCWLHATPERSARARAAMAASAESWIDRGHAYLLDAPSDAVEIARARALEQHCARRAAIRNPHGYGDKLGVQHSGEVNITISAVESQL